MPLIEFARQNEIIEKPEVINMRQKFKRKYLSNANYFNKPKDSVQNNLLVEFIQEKEKEKEEYHKYHEHHQKTDGCILNQGDRVRNISDCKFEE